MKNYNLTENSGLLSIFYYLYIHNEVIGWFFPADPANFSALEKSQTGIRKCSKSYKKNKKKPNLIKSNLETWHLEKQSNLKKWFEIKKKRHLTPKGSRPAYGGTKFFAYSRPQES